MKERERIGGRQRESGMWDDMSEYIVLVAATLSFRGLLRVASGLWSSTEAA